MEPNLDDTPIIEGGVYLCGMFCVKKRVTKIENGFWWWQKRLWYVTVDTPGEPIYGSTTVANFKRHVRGRSFGR